MVEVLRNKNLATKFQILVEIASGGPNIQQRDIAQKLKVTPQAISDYIGQLTEEGLVTSDGRSHYKVTAAAVDWIIKVQRELRNYSAFVERAINNISICAAIAECNLAKGQPVGLKMKNGLLFATDKLGQGARGIACSDTRAGSEVGVSNIEGIVSLEIGQVTILQVSGIQRGGSQAIDSQKLKNAITGANLVGAIGIEAIVALKQADADSIYAYGVTEAAIEAAHSGLNSVVVCVDDMASSLVNRLEEENVGYKLIDIAKD